jgi:hypothetical protein
LALALVLVGLPFGWVPNDDGTLAHTADRVRQGEVPHRDFDEPYTGGLSYLNAIALEAIGDSMLALRFPMFVLASTAVISLFALLRRTLSPIRAALLTLAGSAMSVFVYPVPMPSWYNVFLGTIALYLVVRYVETNRMAWLVAAGAASGISITVKVTAAFFVLACGLVLAVNASRRGGTERRWSLIVLCLASLAVAGLIATMPNPMTFVLLFAPMALLTYGVWQSEPPPEDGSSQHPLLVELAALAVGAAVPLGLFFMLFAGAGALDDLLLALLGVPDLIGRLAEGFPAPYGLPVLVLIGLVLALGGRVGLPGPAMLVLGMAPVLVIYLLDPRGVVAVVYGIWVWVPLALGVAVSMALARRALLGISETAVLAGALCAALLMFPNANPIYLVFSVFLVVPAAGLATTRLLPGGVSVAVLGLLVASSAVFVLGKAAGPLSPLGSESSTHVELDIARLGVRVHNTYESYEQVIDAVMSLSSGSGSIIAGPSSPEIYYLAAVPNPTPLTLEHLALRREGALLTTDYLRALSPSAVVVNRVPPNGVSPSSMIQEAEQNCRLLLELDRFFIFDQCRWSSAQ